MVSVKGDEPVTASGSAGDLQHHQMFGDIKQVLIQICKHRAFVFAVIEENIL